MKRRVFIALALSQTLRDEIVAWEQHYQRLPVRWIAAKNLHVTIIPPWYEENVPRLIPLLRNIQGHPFVMEFTAVSCGPRRHSPRLLWATGKVPQQALDLKSSLENVLRVPPHHSRFLPHITLARFSPRDCPRFPLPVLTETVSWRQLITEFALMESRVSQIGSDYTVIERFEIYK